LILQWGKKGKKKRIVIGRESGRPKFARSVRRGEKFHPEEIKKKVARTVTGGHGNKLKLR